MVKKVGYVVLIIIAFVVGTQIDINFKTSQVFTSDVIAVVNNDQKVKYLDGNLKLGDNFVDQVSKAKGQYDFQTTSSAEADQGLINGKYGAEITIPSNFTNSIISVNSEAPKSTSITYTMNDKLLSSKSKKMEDTIINNISDFEENIIYMYVYSIFDGLHATQEGVGTVGKNSQAVFPFLDDLNEINIVSNHEYKLKDNNTDSFTAIDISEQLAAFAETVASYKAEVVSVIEIYKEQNDEYSTLVDESLDTMNENDDLLNDRISNVKDTLDTIVKSDTQYTTDDFSITGGMDNLKNIIPEYLTQLATVNNTYDLNEETIKNLKAINVNLEQLKENNHLKDLSNLINNRIIYYSSLDDIVTTCLKNENDEYTAKTCVDNSIVDYKSKYKNYDNIISQFKNEEEYYQTMTYDLEHIGETTNKETTNKKTGGKTRAFKLPITADKPDSNEEKDDKSVELSVSNFGENLTAEGDNENNQIGIHLSNVSNMDSLTIDISNKKNISNITHVVTNLDNCKVVVKDDKIQISKIQSNELNLLFNVDKRINSMKSKVILSYDGQNKTVTIGKKNPLTVNVTSKGAKTTLNYQYTLREDDEVVAYTNSSLISKYGDTQLLEVIGDSVKLTKDGFEINGKGKSAGDVINFSIIFNNIAGNLIEEYSINNTKYSFPIVIETSSVSSTLSVIDNQYKVEDDRVRKEENDEDSSDQVEPGDKIGINYGVNFVTDEPITISNISFDTNLQSLLGYKVKPADVIVKVGDSIKHPRVTTANNTITLDFGTDGTLADKSTEIDIYINANVESPIKLTSLDDKYYATFNNLKVTYNSDKTLIDETNRTDMIDLAIGNPELKSVDYTVDSASCSSAIKIDDCNFEAGETITKKITLTNDSSDPAAGLELDDIMSSSGLTLSSINYNYALLADSNPFEFNPETYIKDNIKDKEKGKIYFSMPANSTLVITEELVVNKDLTTSSVVNDTTTFNQYSLRNHTATANINIAPLKLNISVLDQEQVTEDGFITPNEAVNITLKVENESTDSISHNQSIYMKASDSSVIASSRIMAVEDEAWNPIDYTTNGTDEIIVNQDLAPYQSFTIKLRVNFSDFTSSTSETLSFAAYENAYSESGADVEYQLEKNPNYLEDARHQAGVKINGETYGQSLEQSQGLKSNIDNIFWNIRIMTKHIKDYDKYDAELDKFTILDNSEIIQLLSQLATGDFSIKGYCTNSDGTVNNELSCSLFRLYDQIEKREALAKSHYLEVLNLIDPSLDELIGTKPNEDGEEPQPLNIGADFNGYGECQAPDSEVGSEVSPDDCEYANPGIDKRIDMQDENVGNLKDNVNKILDNETEKVDEEPYKQKVTEINEETNQVMDKVETDNNDLFGKKIDIYNDNYKTVMKYVKEISDDPAYTNAIKKFNKNEKGRQKESKVILENVYNLLPNTSLDGIPNKLVYSFISKPFTIEEATNKQPVTTITDAEHPWILIAIFIGFMLTVILIGIIYYINREV